MVAVWSSSKGGFLSKDRLVFVAFAAVYASFLVVNLGYNSIRWDELVHCLGAWQLIHGRFLEYLTSSTFYPPMFNLVTAGFFGAGGANMVSARLVSVTFTVLSVAVLFEFVNRMYGSKGCYALRRFLCRNARRGLVFPVCVHRNYVGVLLLIVTVLLFHLAAERITTSICLLAG